MQYIGKIDNQKLGKYKDIIVADEVILTDERIMHIKEHHPGDYEKYHQYIKEIISDPDYILDDNKNIDTVIFLKDIKKINKNIQIVIRLNTNLKEKNMKNTILTMWKIKTKTYRQMVRNKEVILKRLDKNE